MKRCVNPNIKPINLNQEMMNHLTLFKIGYILHLHFFPEILDRNLHEKTLCMEAMFEWGSHYNTHSLYGYSMSKQSLR